MYVLYGLHTIEAMIVKLAADATADELLLGD